MAAFPEPPDLPEAPDLPDRLVAPAGLRDVGFPDGAVLVHAERARTSVLNQTAYAAWLACADGASLDEATTELATAYRTPPDAIRADVARILVELLRDGWLHDGGPEAAALSTQRLMGCAPDEPRAQEPVPHQEHWHLPVESSPCQQTLDRRPWHGTVAVRVGRFHVGVRCDARATLVIAEHLFADQLVDDPDAPVDFSLVLGSTGAGEEFPRKGLYEGRTFVTSSEEPGAVLETLIARLSGLAKAPAGVVRLAAVAVPDPSGAGVVLHPHPRGATLGPSTQERAVAAAPLALAVQGGGVELVDGWIGVHPDAELIGRMGVRAPTGGRVIGLDVDTERRTQAQVCADLIPLLHTAPDDDPDDGLALLRTLVLALAPT